jgi:hypothetical protein
MYKDKVHSVSSGWVNQNPDWVGSERFYVEVFLNPSSGPENLLVGTKSHSVFFYVAPVLIVSQ